jgi:L-threonine kinase
MIEYHRTQINTATASAPGTCGELVQGQFKDGRDFLVTLPVNRLSVVRVELNRSGREVVVLPADKIKTRQAIRKTLDHLGYPSTGARSLISSRLPEGKGMASSTADIVAACKAVAKAVEQPLSAEQISWIAGQIEPSDGIMYPGVVCYNHRQCELIERLGRLPPMRILVADTGQTVDTIQFNHIPKNYTFSELAQIEAAYRMVAAGIKEKNLKLIGEAAAISARINQRLLPKPQLEQLIAIAETHGAYGVNAAHSGTVIGLLFDADADEAIRQAKAEITSYIDITLPVFEVKTIGASIERPIKQ